MFRQICLVSIFTVLYAHLVLGYSSSKLMAELVKEYTSNTKARLPYYGPCTPDNIAVRKEWGDLNETSRLEYINAVKCLHSLPSKIGEDKVPGARSRYDDFEAAHIINTREIHATGLFFPWHRHYVQIFEKALREECGYSGYQPYWDWAKWADRPPEENPLYDGSETSMSGNGFFIPNRNGTVQPFPIPVEDPPEIYAPPGTGGGYIFEGPFVNWTKRLGPVIDMNVRNGQPVPNNPREDGLGYNPRPIIRDFNNTLLRNASYDVLTYMLTNLTTIETFDPYFNTVPHLAGHLFISGYDNDIFTSPGDPLFWFHHAQVDRIWSIWQALDFKAREYAITGTLTLVNVPPSRNATLNDTMKFEVSPDIPIRAAMSATDKGYCFIYD